MTPEQERWDFVSNAQITIGDIDVNGAQRRVVMHAPKNGFFYVLDAKTGEFLPGENFVPTLPILASSCGPSLPKAE